MKKVCFFVREFPVLSQTFVIQQINGLISEGHEVEIASLYQGPQELWSTELLNKNKLQTKTKYLMPLPVEDESKVTMIFQILCGFAKLLLTKFSAATFILKNIKRIVDADGLLFLKELVVISNNKENIINSNVVIAHFGEIGVRAGLLAQLGMMTSNIFTIFHGYEVSEYKVVERWKNWYLWLSKNSSKLLPISELWSKKLQALGISGANIQVVHMGIDLSRFIHSENKFMTTPIKILSVARAVEKKGLTYSLKGVAMSNADIEYHIIGEGPLLMSLKEQVSNYQTNVKFIFHGPKPSSFVVEKLQSCDLFILTSVTGENGDMEGIPVSLMEAMATGAIVLSTEHSGIPELIENEVNGFLVPERDAEAITSAIRKILIAEDLAKIRQNAYKKVDLEFNQSLLNKQMSKLINDQKT